MLFSSGMSAISTTILAFARPGDVILHSQPLYGGTETLLARTMADFNIAAVGFVDGVSEPVIRAAVQEARGKGRISVIMIETPANPTNTLVDIKLLRRIADEIGAAQGFRPVLVVTIPAGPVFQRPSTMARTSRFIRSPKYVGEVTRHHSRRRAGLEGDPRADQGDGAASGTNLDPHSCWMLGRSLESGLRMERSKPHARLWPNMRDHPKVDKVHHLDFLDEAHKHSRSSPAMHRRGLDLLLRHQRRRESGVRLSQRPADLKWRSVRRHRIARQPSRRQTHSGVPVEVRDRIGVLDTTIRRRSARASDD